MLFRVGMWMACLSRIRSQQEGIYRPSHQAAVRLVLLLQSRHLPRPKFSRVFSPSLHQPRPFSISILAVRSRRSGFLIQSRIFSSMRLRFQKTMITPLSRTLLILQCFSLLATLMLQHPCPNLAEVVAVPPLNLIGAKGMKRTNVCLLVDASRWLTPCASQSQLNVVIIAIPYVKYQKK